MKKFTLLIALLLVAVTQARAVTGSITVVSAACATASQCVNQGLPSTAGSASVQVSGTFTGTLQFEATVSGSSTWVAVSGKPLPSGVDVSSTTATGTWQFNIASLSNIRVRASAFASGTAVVVINYSTAIAKSALGGGVGGSGAATQVAYWDNATTLAGNASLTWNNTTKTFLITNTGGSADFQINKNAAGSNARMLFATGGTDHWRVGLRADNDFSILDVTGALDTFRLSTGGRVFFPQLTTGSIPFIGAGGEQFQDNANLFWEDAENSIVAGERSGWDADYFGNYVAQQRAFIGVKESATLFYGLTVRAQNSESTSAPAISAAANGASAISAQGGNLGNFTNQDANGIASNMYFTSDQNTTNSYGVRITEGGNDGAGTITNNIGLSIGNMSMGTNDWAINTGLGLNEFGDQVKVNNASPFILEGATADAFEQTIAVTDPAADATATFPNSTFTVGQIEVTHHAQAAGALVDQTFFWATRAYQVTACSFGGAVAETTAATLAVQVTKDTGTNAPGAGTDLLTNNTNAGFDVKATANTTQTGTLTATTADLQLAAGNRLAVDYSAAATEGAGITITCSLRPN